MATTHPSASASVSAEQWREEVERIVASPHFRSAPQLQNLLRYLVDRKLEGREEELKEYTVGLEVFRRGAGYNPKNDSIVRVQASILRKRLHAYYEEEGKLAPLRIDLPKGAYVPQLKLHMEEASEDGDPSESSPPPAPVLAPTTTEPRHRAAIGIALAILGAATASFLAGLHFSDRFRNEGLSIRLRPGSAELNSTVNAIKVSPSIWGTLLRQGKPVVLAFGCPQFFRGGGLYVRHIDINGDSGAAIDPKLRVLSDKLNVYLLPAPDTYTGVGEVMGLQKITQFLVLNGILSDVENVQVLTKEALRDKTFVLVSSFRFRHLLHLMDLPNAIVPDYAHTGFRLRDPRDGERSLYSARESGAVGLSYGLISLWREAEPAHRVLLISGIDSWSTQGTSDFVTDEKHLQEIEQHLAHEPLNRSRGVQILVEVESINSRPSATRYVTHRLL